MRHTGTNKKAHIITKKAGVKFFALAFLLLTALETAAQNDTVINRTVDEIVVKAEKKRNVSVNSTGRITLSAPAMKNMPRVLGEADPLKYILMLPGAGTSSDYASGISVQGCDYSQTFIGIDGVPVFFPYHLFGIFSVCNPTHFSDVIFEKSIHETSFENRLGGLIDLKPKQHKVKRLSGDFNAGMLASSFTLEIPCGKKISAFLSSRISYISLFYSPLLNTLDGEIKYNFQDMNFTGVYRINYYNKLVFNAFYDNDDFLIKETGSIGLSLSWQNRLFSASWQHEGAADTKLTAFYSGFNSCLDLTMAKNKISVPSEISASGLKFVSDYPFFHDKCILKSGGSLAYYTLCPQGVDSDFGGRINPDTKDYEGSAFCQNEYNLGGNLSFVLGMKYSAFKTENTCFQNFAPLFTVNFNALGCEFSAHFAVYTQYLHQIGFSDVGLSTNSWIEISKKLPPQKSNAFSLCCLKEFDGGKYVVQAEGYYKKVSGQCEFFGNIFDLFSTEYSAENYIEHGEGYNTGIDLLVNKNAGNFFGNLGYSAGLSRRKFTQFYDGYLPSSNEILQTIKVDANYKAGRKWLLSAVFNYSSGRPVTPIKYVYMIGEKLIAEYGRHNSARLKDYHRLDISASYKFPGRRNGRFLNSINLTVINVYGKENTELRYYKLSLETNKILYREKTSVFRFMPSLSYSVHF